MAVRESTLLCRKTAAVADNFLAVMTSKDVIFLVENSTDYLFSLDQEFRKAGLSNPVRVARYGNEAILYLKGIGIYEDREHYPLPDLMVVDLSLPDGSAMAVLGWLRKQPQFQDMPILILIPPTQKHFGMSNFSRDINSYFLLRDDVSGVVQVICDLAAFKNEVERSQDPKLDVI